VKLYNKNPGGEEIQENVDLMYMVEPPHHIIKLKKELSVVEMQ
jgi:hypothetical protein